MQRRMKGAIVVIAMLTALVPVAAAHASDGGDDGDQLHGTVTFLPPGPTFIGTWMVSVGTGAPVTVIVNPATEIETEGGSLVMGAFVEVKGVADATGLIITASKIELSDGEGDDEDGDEDGDATLTGTLQSASGAPGVWTVSHHGVVVTAHTRIVRNGHALHRGARLRVVGHWRPNGSMRASKIVVKR